MLNTDNEVRLAADHWEYVGSVLQHSGVTDSARLSEIEFHYKSAFRHGYKHAKEENQQRVTNLTPENREGN